MDAATAVTIIGAGGIAAAAAATILARSARTAVIWTGMALVLWPVTLAPFPAPLPLAFWLVAALLATFVLFAPVREPTGPLAPLPLGGGAEAAFVVVGLALGWVVAPMAGAGRGTDASLAAAAAAALAALSLAGFSRDTLRTGIGAVFAVESGALLVSALAATPTAAAVLAFALAELGVAAAAAAVIVADRAVRGASPAAVAAPLQGVPPGAGRGPRTPRGEPRQAGGEPRQAGGEPRQAGGEPRPARGRRTSPESAAFPESDPPAPGRRPEPLPGAGG